MKLTLNKWTTLSLWAMAMTTVLSVGSLDALADAGRTVVVTAQADPADEDPAPGNSVSNKHKLVIRAIEADDLAGKRNRAPPWLGVSTEETSEALAVQLGLETGAGLLVTYVAPNSPAAKAGLQKNDVLAEFEGQVLVHPAQLRKLIHMHKEGDTVKLTVFRAGKKQTLTATVGKTAASLGLFRDERSWNGDWHVLQRQLHDLPIGEAMKSLQESLAQAGIDKETLNKDIKRSVEEVRKAIQEALRQATNASRTFGPAARDFQELARRGMDVENDATVVVKSRRNSVKSIVKTDDTGTYVVVASPNKQLTAHDKAGKLLFDGEIQTAEQQAQVPRKVWEQVKPMIEQLEEDKPEGDPPKAEAESDEK